MSIKIKYQWRITKYNPVYRNEHGGYTIESEWTSSSDIGKNIDGEILTLEGYLKIETAYIDTIMKFLQVNQIDFVRILKVTYIDGNKNSILYDKDIETLQLQDDCEVPASQIPLLAKMTLREFIHCDFMTEDFFVHFGYDYYMYIGSNHYDEEPLEFAEAQGLFVEEMISAYYVEEKDIIRSVIWIELGNSIIVDEELLPNIELDEYRKALHLSYIHPVTGVFPITPNNQDFFQSKINHQIDFTKYEYYLASTT
ncbi:DUF7683 domain-containing protein [Metasolibacillus meyeri]|uniref:DUF7683 domain-containing protein n=1 Tax=Metasolibacillus meyeri TaxID=1071052 RepID=UPI000D30C96D|nr:hypothetical protein [Metasolibacillus meyeri]